MKPILLAAAICLLIAAPACAAAGRRARVRIIAVQVKVRTEMYRDAASYRAAMDAAISDAAKQKARTCPTLVALPEDIGLGLVFLGQWDTVKGAKGIRDAGALLGTKLGPDVMANASKFGVSPTRALLLTANDKWLRKTYYHTFSALAAKYKVYLAAGSAPLSAAGSGEVRNVAVLFGPSGNILGEWSKVHLIDLEGPEGLDLAPGKVEGLQAVNTPFGKVGTAVCYDGFHDDVLDRLKDQGAEFILQPSFNPQIWSPEQETDWATGLWQRLKARPGIVGVNPMAVGNLFDIVCEGRTNIVGAEAPPGGYYGRMKSATEPGMILLDVY
jgi:predicted amidohydrolase